MLSMTGFGRAEATFSNMSYTIEIKSVNHRYLDARFRLPYQINSLEISLNERLRTHFQRGSFDISIKQKVSSEANSFRGNTKFVIDQNALDSFKDNLRWLESYYEMDFPVSVETLVMTNRVFVPIESTNDSEQWKTELLSLFDKACLDLKKTRQSEGNKIQKILDENLNQIHQIVNNLPQLLTVQTKAQQEKLKKKFEQWQLPGAISPERLEWEIALLIDKSDITEEIDRLKAHVVEFKTLIQSPDSIGRKLDFMTQELHREANTIGSKAATLEVTKNSLELKAWIEKLREQIQNVE